VRSPAKAYEKRLCKILCKIGIQRKRTAECPVEVSLLCDLGWNTTTVVNHVTHPPTCVFGAVTPAPIETNHK
jgi:hypothetical protein